jgi:anaerobic selenocysteine-containing dehydrogenase
MMETKKSFCRFCHASCGIEVDVEENRVLAVRGDPDNVVSQGYTCIKGRAELERIYHPDRLLAAQKLADGRRNETPPEQALDEIAAKLKEIIDKYGPRSVAAYVGCGGYRNSASGPWYASKFIEALGSPSMYTCFTVDSPGFSVALFRLFGGPVPVSLFDVPRADVAMFVGTNPVDSKQLIMPQSNPLKRLRDSQKRGMKLIVIDPRRSSIARLADIHLQVKPGEDPTLLAGMIRVVLDEQLYDKEYVLNTVSGVDELRVSLEDFDLAYVSKRTRVPENLILEAARMFAAPERGGATSGQGVHMSRHQNLGIHLVMTLNALCGRYDRPGGLVRNEGALGFEIQDGMGPLPLALESGQTSRIRGIKGIFNVLGGFNELPSNTLTDEILTPGEGQIRALFVLGGNPALVLPDEASTVRALKGLDLLVVNEHFMSATAKFADYVFGVRHPFERPDMTRLADIAFPFPFGQYSPALVDPPEGVLEDWEVYWGLAKRLDIDLNIPNISMDTRPTADALMDGLQPMKRVPLDELKKYPGGHVWGERELKAGGLLPNMIGYEDKKMAVGHPEVLEELRVLRAEPVIEGGGYESDEDCRFRLISYRMQESYCTQGQNLPSLLAKRLFNPLLMHPTAMGALGVKDDDIVVVDSGFGTVEAVVESTEDLQPDVVALAFGWGDPSDERDVREKGSNVQRLIPDDVRYDPVTGLAQTTAIPVNIHPRKSS